MYKNSIGQIFIYEYDRLYDIRINSSYRRSYIGFLSGLIIALSGVALIVASIYDLSYGIYNNGGETSAAATLTWTENPFWPDYGKGIWMGSLALAVAVLGFASQVESTFTSIKVYGVSCLLLTFLSLYLDVSTLVQIDFYIQAAKLIQAPAPFYITYQMNSIIAGVGALLFLTCLPVGIAALGYTGAFDSNRREWVKQIQ